MGIIDTFVAKRNANRKNPQGEMSFMDHIEELRWHIFRSIIAILAGAIIVWLNIDFVFDKILLGPATPHFISYKWFCELGKLIHVDALCMDGAKLSFQNTELSGQFMLSFSVAAMGGFIMVFPYVFWEFWRFLKPALKENELKQANGFVFWSSTLFLLGVSFAYFIISPFTISFFASYELSPQFKNIITISNYYDTMSDLILGMGAVFELPILVYFLSKLGIITPKLLKQYRRYAIVVILFLAAIITPPDWFSIFLVFLPLYGLYEAAIIVSGRINRKERKEEEQSKELDW